MEEAICRLGLERIILDCNTAFARLVGRPRDEIVGKTCCALVHGSEAPPPECPLVRMVRSGIREAWEYPRGDAWVREVVDPVFDDAGALAGAVHRISDISERKRAEEALRQSEARLRTLFEEAPIAISVSRGGVGLYANPKCVELFGLRDASEAVGRVMAEYFAPQSREESRERSRRRAADLPVPIEFDSVGVRCDGTEFPMRLAVARVEFSDGPANVAFVNDMTEAKRAERSLARQLAFDDVITRHLARFTQAEAPELDARIREGLEEVGRCLDAEHAFVVLISPDRTTFSSTHEWRDEGAPDLSRRYQNVPMGTLPWVENTLLRGDAVQVAATQDLPPEAAGYRDWLERDGVRSVLLVPLAGRGHVVAGVVGLRSYSRPMRWEPEDIRRLKMLSDAIASALERQRADAELRGSEQQYRLLFQRAPIGVFHYDDELRITECNDRFVDILASSRGRLIGLDMNSLRDRRVLPAIRQAVRGGYGQYDGPYRATTGTAVPFVSLRTAPLRSEAGDITGGIGIVQDMTEYTHLEEQLRQAQKMQVVGTLAGGVSHDFNNLLQAMLSQAQLLRSRASEPSRVLEVVEELERHINRGASLTRQLLLFSRREPVKPERIDLNDAVRDAAQILERLVPANIAVAVELASERLPVEGDRGQLQQVVMNLALNASDAMANGGRLAIRSGVAGRAEVWFSVGDTGHGIPDPIRERIFEPFFTTKEPGKGTGLGLSVVHGIVTQHGGRIDVESAVGRGSTFMVALPRIGSADVAPTDETAPAAPAPEPGRGERVLVVEDEDGARKGFRDLLGILGYDVVAVASGERARELPASPPFDLLLTDLMLPGVAGPRLARELKERWPALKVILMSGYAEDDAVRQDGPAGGVRFLQKPFGVNALAHEVRAALDEPPDGGSD
jgi:PAS domain S-box-containing protein